MAALYQPVSGPHRRAAYSSAMFEYTRRVIVTPVLMPAPEQVLYAMPAMRALLRAEAAALCARIPGRAGSFGLRLGMQDAIGGCPDAVAHWVRLIAGASAGPGRCAPIREPLPFADEGFAIVWLSQALQFHPGARPAAGSRPLDRARRTAGARGMHPVSAWAPWLSWCMRAGRPLHLLRRCTGSTLERTGLRSRR